MIKSEKQKTKTLKHLESLENERESFLSASIGLPEAIIKAQLGSIDSMIGSLKNEIAEYETIKAGNFELPQNITFVELLRSLTKIRIAKRLSQQDLATLIGVSRQQINRYEEHDYQNVSIEKVNAILEALNINIDLKSAA